MDSCLVLQPFLYRNIKLRLMLTFELIKRLLTRWSAHMAQHKFELGCIQNCSAAKNSVRCSCKHIGMFSSWWLNHLRDATRYFESTIDRLERCCRVRKNEVPTETIAIWRQWAGTVRKARICGTDMCCLQVTSVLSWEKKILSKFLFTTIKL